MTFRGWFWKWFSSDHLAVLWRRTDRLVKRTRRADADLSASLRRLESLRSEMDQQAELASQRIEQARQLNQQLSAALDTTREELRTAHDIIIPGLVAANQVFIDRWDAESQAMTIRSGMTGNRNDIQRD